MYSPRNGAISATRARKITICSRPMAVMRVYSAQGRGRGGTRVPAPQELKALREEQGGEQVDRDQRRDDADDEVFRMVHGGVLQRCAFYGHERPYARGASIGPASRVESVVNNSSQPAS